MLWYHFNAWNLRELKLTDPDREETQNTWINQTPSNQMSSQYEWDKGTATIQAGFDHLLLNDKG